jgi:hypothetical protein
MGTSSSTLPPVPAPGSLLGRYFAKSDLAALAWARTVFVTSYEHAPVFFERVALAETNRGACCTDRKSGADDNGFLTEMHRGKTLNALQMRTEAAEDAADSWSDSMMGMRYRSRSSGS